MSQSIDEALAKLNKSTFRSRFKLNDKQIAYINEKGMETIRKHCEDIISERLSEADPKNDGKQTPMKGHPVFIAQHACACCCRGCLNKWYHVPTHVELTKIQQEKIVNLLMAWIDRQVNREC